MLMVWRDDDKKIHSQFLSYQGVLNWNLFEICHKQKYSTSLLFLGSLLDHFIGHHLHRTSLNQSFIKLWRSLFGDNRTIQTSPEVAEPKIHSITGCSFSSCRGSATRDNEMDCREGCVRKKKKRRWRSIFELKPPGAVFLPRFSHSTFQSEKKHLRFLWAQWTTFTSNIRMKRTCFIYIYIYIWVISEHKLIELSLECNKDILPVSYRICWIFLNLTWPSICSSSHSERSCNYLAYLYDFDWFCCLHLAQLFQLSFRTFGLADLIFLRIHIKSHMNHHKSLREMDV